MRLFFFIFVLLVVVPIPALGEGGNYSNYEYEAETPNGLVQEKLITLTGDSITYGVINDYDNCSKFRCFAALLSIYFAVEEKPRAMIVNYAMSGGTSRDYDPNDYNPGDFNYKENRFTKSTSLFGHIPASDMVIHYVGTNDSVGYLEIGGRPIAPEIYSAYMFDFYRTLKRRGVKHVVLVTPPVPLIWQGTDIEDRMVAYGDAIRRICKQVRQSGCLLDLQASYPKDEWGANQVHPTVEGHAFIALEYSRHIEKVLWKHK